LNEEIGEKDEKNREVERVKSKEEVESTLKHNYSMSNNYYELDKLNYGHPRFKCVE
jgi:transcriptional regulator of NAD metabolism